MKSLVKGIVWGLIAVLILSTSAWAFGPSEELLNNPEVKKAYLGG